MARARLREREHHGAVRQACAVLRSRTGSIRPDGPKPKGIAAAASTALHRTATKCTMTTKTGTQVSKRQFISVLAAIPSTIGMCHLAVYLKLGTPAEGWASLTGFFVALPGWMALARRYRRE